ncbi:hypothetical protein [Bradyrhizobium sp. LTSPM299]|jgi:hypothetical protein|uniref:hypothetical protein n=1 Tax=Bradyrhizobium sp. LTSPM299 TaxID=1619233 RepID=UPI000AA45598|nr:hypothetical protein [Bradyrhizobium sp. LTSPM299]
MRKQMPSKENRSMIVFLELGNRPDAMTVAQKIADNTGHAIVVRDSEGIEIDTVFPTKH